MTGKIYKITNQVNGKVYIGQTTKSLKERFNKHCWATSSNDVYHQSMAIKLAIHKYGKENFKIELIEECDINKLDEREVYWISYYDSYNNGYNCTKGGQNGATRPTKLSWKEECEVIEAKYLGFGNKEIAEVYNINRSSIFNIFKRHNLIFPKPLMIAERINKQEFIEFLETNPSQQDIADHFHICKCSVYKYMKSHHIEYNFSTSVRPLTDNAEGENVLRTQSMAKIEK